MNFRTFDLLINITAPDLTSFLRHFSPIMGIICTVRYVDQKIFIELFNSYSCLYWYVYATGKGKDRRFTYSQK